VAGILDPVYASNKEDSPYYYTGIVHRLGGDGALSGPEEDEGGED